MIASLILAVALAGQTPAAPQPAPAPNPQPAVDDALRAVAVTRVFPHWQDFQAIAAEERDAFTLLYKFSGPTEWRLWLEEADGALTYLGDGPVARIDPPALAHFERNAQLKVNAPEGGMSVSMLMAPTTDLSTQYVVTDLTSALSQAGRAMRHVAGAAALFAPRIDTVLFVFEGPAPTAIATMGDGSQVELPVEGHLVRFPSRDRRFRQAVRLEFGHAPIDVQLTPR